MLFNCDFCHQNVQMYEEKEELVTIIKQAAKERLQMEKQLAKIRPNPVSLEGTVGKCLSLSSGNSKVKILIVSFESNILKGIF